MNMIYFSLGWPRQSCLWDKDGRQCCHGNAAMLFAGGERVSAASESACAMLGLRSLNTRSSKITQLWTLPLSPVNLTVPEGGSKLPWPQGQAQHFPRGRPVHHSGGPVEHMEGLRRYRTTPATTSSSSSAAGGLAAKNRLSAGLPFTLICSCPAPVFDVLKSPVSSLFFYCAFK